MLRGTLLTTRYAIAALVLLMFAADVQAQLIGRRLLRRDAKAMEEYYDDLEDYYEDRNPRLAREAERMENYYEDVRKGRAVGPPPLISLPGLRLRIDPLLRGDQYAERPATARSPAVAQEQPRSRWHPWGEATDANLAGDEAAPPTPTPAPERSEVRRASYEEGFDGGNELQFPSTASNVPSQPGLDGAYAALQRQFERIAKRQPDVARQWSQYLEVPASESDQVSSEEFYATADGRQQLSEALAHYDTVAEDPQFRKISRMPAFGATRAELRKLLASLEQQPTLAEPQEQVQQAEELPAPPAN